MSVPPEEIFITPTVTHVLIFLSQMDPKLRPSFSDIVRHLEEILARLKVEEMEQECVPLGGDNDKKTVPKGNGSKAPKTPLFSAF